MQGKANKSVKTRLARIEGQVRGVRSMVEEERYCLDVVTQVRAARGALAKVEEIVLADHLACCVERAIVSGNPSEQRKAVAELIEVFSCADR